MRCSICGAKLKKAGDICTTCYKAYQEVERETIVYDKPDEIILRIKNRQEKIDAAFNEFQKLLNS